MMVGGVVRSFALVLAVCAATAASAAETSKQSAGKPSPSRQAALPSFEFRGHRIGEPIEQNFPYWAQGYRGMNLPYCGELKIPGIYICEDHTVEVDSSLGKRSMIGDVPIVGLDYLFLDGRLYSLNMYSDIRVYNSILGMLIGKYGNPQREYVESVEDKKGILLRNLITEWKFKEGSLEFHKRLNSNSSLLIFSNPKADAEIERRSQAQNSVKGRQAF